jgi:hypothetical protein
MKLLSFAQAPSIKGCIENYYNSEIVIQDFDGSTSSYIDTLETDAGGCFEISFASSRRGQLRLLMQNRQFLDFFIDGQPVTFNADFKNLLGTIDILEGDESKLYYDYLKYKVSTEYKQRSLQRLLSDTLQPEFREEIISELNLLHNQDSRAIEQLRMDYPQSIVAKVLSLDLTPNVPDSLEGEEMEEFMLYHFFDYLDFNDTILIKTNALSVKIISYLSLGLNEAKDFDRTVSRLSDMSFYLLYRSMENEAMFSFIKTYLQNGFKILGYKDLVKEIEGISFNCCACNDSKNDNNQSLLGKKFPRIKTVFPKGKILPVKKEESLILLASKDCEVSSKLIEEVIKTKGDMPLYILYEERELKGQDNEVDLKEYYIDSRAASKLPQVKPYLFHVDRSGKIVFQTGSWLEVRFNRDYKPAASTSTR